jgi:hypothetical protein
MSNEVVSGDIISVSDLALGDITYTSSNTDGAQSDYASIIFAVSYPVYDFSGTILRETKYSSNLFKLIINVVSLPESMDDEKYVKPNTINTINENDIGVFYDEDGGRFHTLRLLLSSNSYRGTIRLSGSIITTDTDITLERIRNRELTYEPLSGAIGLNYTSIKFKVSDGVYFSTSSYALTIHIKGPPVSADSTITMFENTAYTFLNTDFGS